MKVEIEIPKEFEDHFVRDHFRDSLMRLNLDAHELAGNYEQEMAKMLVKAFKDAKVLSEEKIQGTPGKTAYIDRFVKGELAVHIKNSEEYLDFITALRQAGVEISNPADYPLNSGFYDPHYPFFFMEIPEDMYMNANRSIENLYERPGTLSIKECIDYNKFVGGYEKSTKDNSPKPASAKDFAQWIDAESGMTIIDSNNYGEYSPVQFSAEELLEMMIKTNQKQNDVDLEVSNDDLER